MGVERGCRALRAVPLRRRLAVVVGAVTVLGMVSTGACAQASPSAASATATAAHKAPVPSVVHPSKPPQGAAGGTRTGKAPAVVVGNQPKVPVKTLVYSPSMRAQMSAQAQARQSGKPVVVSALTTPTQQVVAQPNGLYELQSSVYPVRVQRNGAWVAVSTQLVPAGGGWAPAAVSTPMVFSGGGASPLATVTDAASGGTVRVWWPSPLPRPVVSGSVALYRSVLPGVDLRLEATDAGYSDVLIVHNAAAAANPALRSMSERVQVSAGLLAAPGTGGSLVVTNAQSGNVVLTFGQALMWDASDARPQIATRPSADFSGSGRITAVPVGYQAAGTGAVTVTMHPPAAALTGPAVRYPLYIDPSTGDTKTTYYAEVMQDSKETESWTTTSGTTSVNNNDVEVGYCGFTTGKAPCGRTDGAATYTMRTYYRFPTSELQHQSGVPAATIYDVDFNVQQLSLADHSCTAQPAHLWSTNADIGSSTTWPGPYDQLLATGSSNAGGTDSSGNCGPGYLDINSASSGNSALAGNLQDGANKAVATMAFMLAAADESNDLQYRVVSDSATLDVYYNYPPTTPVPTRVSNQTSCTKDSSGNSIYYTSDNTPNVYATGYDNNSPELNLDWNFTVVDSSGTSHPSGWLNNSGNTGYAPGAAPGTERWWTATALPDGASSYTAQTRNVPTDGKAAQLSSGTSSSFSFTVQSATPATPSISSFDYPPGQWGQAAGEPGAFTVSASGDSTVAGFSYAFNGTPATVPQGSGSPACDYLTHGGLGTSVIADANGKSYDGAVSGVLAVGPAGTAQILTPLVGTNGINTGRNTLTVEAFNSAHVPSATYIYAFYVPNNYQSTSTFTDASTFYPSQVSGPDTSQLKVQPNCCTLTWPSGGQLQFLSTAVNQTFTIPLTVPGSGSAAIPYQLGVYMTESYNYGKVRVDLDSGTNLGGTATVPFDGYSPTVKGGYLDLGTPMLIPGSPHTLTFTVTGANASSTGYEVGVVYLAIGATNRYQADSLGGSSGTTGQPHQQCLNQASWSDDCQLFFTNATQGASFTANFYAPMDSDYALGASLVTAKDYGTEQFVVDPGSTCIPLYGSVSSSGGCTGSQSVSFDAYTSSVAAQYLFLGSAHLKSGWHTLQVTVNGKNASSTSYNGGINFLQVVPVTGTTVTDFTSAMNNQGIAYDGATTTMTSNFDLLNTATGNNLSEQSLQSAGLITAASTAGKAWTGKSFSLNGAQFTMPAPRVDGSSNVIADNVIPDGQTIPFPAAQQVKATGVALLASSTCHGSAEATAAITYADGSGQNPTIPALRDWFAGSQGPAVISLGHYDAGSTANTSHQPYLYEVMLPASPASALSSITLPVMGQNFLPDAGTCGTSGNFLQTLHILAIGVVPASNAAVPIAYGGGGVWTGAYNGPMDTSVCCETTANETFREVIPLSSAGGGYVRIHLSNAYTAGPVTFDDVTVAAQAAGGGGATAATPVQLNFGTPSSTTLTLAAGADAYSNPVAMPALTANGRLTVSMHIASIDTTVPSLSIHDQVQGMGTFYAAGDQAGNSDTAGTTFTSGSSLDGVLYLASVDVSSSTVSTPVNNGTQYTGTVAVLGDQGAVSAPAWSSGNWPWYLQAALGSATVNGAAAPVNVAGSVVNASTSDSIPDDWWRMNGGGADSGSTAWDSGTAAVNNLTLTGTPAWSTASPGTGTTSGSLNLNGSTQYGATQSPPAVPPSNSSSFAVSAWVNPTSVPATGDAVAVARDGSSASEYYLGAHNGNWGFWFTGSDATSPTVTGAYGGAATTGTWTLLTGVYNGSAGQIQLFVNGVKVASTAFTPAWTANGALTVGSGLVSGSQSDFLAGYVSDVRYYNRVMWPDSVSEVYNDTGMSSVSAMGVAGAMTSDQAKYGSSGWVDYEAYAAGEPNVRDVIVSLGANDILQGQSEGAIETSLLAIVTNLQGWSLTQSPGTRVNVFVTTIPPLGLSGQREATRGNVNSWILGGAGQAGVPNLPSTVPHFDITSAYPAGGLSTAADYQGVATLVANDIAGWMASFHPPHSTW